MDEGRIVRAKLEYCDVLSGCPKAAGIQQAVGVWRRTGNIRRLGRRRNRAVLEGLNSGVSLSSAHCSDETPARRPPLVQALESGAFELVVLSRAGCARQISGVVRRDILAENNRPDTGVFAGTSAGLMGFVLHRRNVV